MENWHFASLLDQPGAPSVVMILVNWDCSGVEMSPRCETVFPVLSYYGSIFTCSFSPTVDFSLTELHGITRLFW